MQKHEVINFMKKIKAYYQSFSMEDYVVNEWFDRLKNYDIEDVYAKLDQHLNGECKEQIPKLHYITRFLKTPEEKKQSDNDFIVDCNLCYKPIKYSNYNNHYNKCLSIKFLMKQINKNDSNVSYEELEDLYDNSRDTYEKVYEKYRRIYERRRPNEDCKNFWENTSDFIE